MSAEPRVLYPDRKADRRTESEEASMEVRALEHERRGTGRELRYLSLLLQRAVWTERLDLVQEAAGRLAYLSDRLTRQGGQGA